MSCFREEEEDYEGSSSKRRGGKRWWSYQTEKESAPPGSDLETNIRGQTVPDWWNQPTEKSVWVRSSEKLLQETEGCSSRWR